MNSISQPILITGAAGFVGANITHHLVKKKLSVHVVVHSNKNLWRIRALLPYITIHCVDLTNQKEVEKLLQKVMPQTIYHFASYGNYPFQQDPLKILHTNIMSTQYLLEACRSLDFRCFINISTSSEYGFKNHPMTEDTVAEPRSFYGLSKNIATRVSKYYSQRYGKPVITLRLFSVYGPFEEKTRFIPTIIMKTMDNASIALTKSVARRDFIYIDDVVRALVCATKSAHKISGQIINVGTGKQYSNEDIVKILFKITHKSVPIDFDAFPSRAGDSAYWVADVSKAKRLLNWEANCTIEEGLKKTLNWFKRNRSLYEN